MRWSVHLPMGFVPTTIFGTIDNPNFCPNPLTSWRIELSDFPANPQVWHNNAAPKPASDHE